MIDPDRVKLNEATIEFNAKLKNSDVALLYYAGHSIQIDDENYLIQKDAELRSPNAIGEETMAASEIVNAMDRMAKTKVIILDACRDNPFKDRLEAAFKHDGQERGPVAGSCQDQATRGPKKARIYRLSDVRDNHSLCGGAGGDRIRRERQT